MPHMTNAAIQERLTKLETEVKTLKNVLRETARAHLRTEIMKGLNSGPGVLVDAKYWEQKMALTRKVHKEARAKRAKKLPKWLQASLKDIEEGRVSGPFNTVEELMADLNGPGK